MKKLETLNTARLILRRPVSGDAASIFQIYASDPQVTRYLAWPRHRTIEQTRAFLAFSDGLWETWDAGPYLIVSRESGELLGSTGFDFEAPHRAMTGYVLAASAWGRGYATEALAAIAALAPEQGIVRLSALCHPQHRASWRVLEKCGFAREGCLKQHTVFPNLGSPVPADVLCYVKLFVPSAAPDLSLA